MVPNPTFLVIGGRRCGTHWLQRALMEHPEIFVPPGRPGYEGLGERDTARYRGEKAVGLVNAAWMADPDAPRRLYEAYPQAKIVAIVRSPPDRAYSWYLQCLKQGDDCYQAQPTFEEALQCDPSIFEEGFYHRHLSSYLELFSPQNFVVLVFDRLLKDPAGYLQGLFTELDVDPTFKPSVLDTKVNYSVNIRSRLLHRLARQTKAVLLAVSGNNEWLVDRLQSTRLVERFQRMNGKSYPPLSEARRRELQALYRDDIRALSDTFGIDVSHWGIR